MRMTARGWLGDDLALLPPGCAAAGADPAPLGDALAALRRAAPAMGGRG